MAEDGGTHSVPNELCDQISRYLQSLASCSPAVKILFHNLRVEGAGRSVRPIQCLAMQAVMLDTDVCAQASY